MMTYQEYKRKIAQIRDAINFGDWAKVAMLASELDLAVMNKEVDWKS